MCCLYGPCTKNYVQIVLSKQKHIWSDSPSHCYVNKLALLLQTRFASQCHLLRFLYYLFLINSKWTYSYGVDMMNFEVPPHLIWSFIDRVTIGLRNATKSTAPFWTQRVELSIICLDAGTRVYTTVMHHQQSVYGDQVPVTAILDRPHTTCTWFLGCNAVR